MTGYEKIISLMYDLKNKYKGEITELSLQKRCCTYFLLSGWPFYIKAGEGDVTIYVPYKSANKLSFYLTNRNSILHMLKNIKRMELNSYGIKEIYYNTNDKLLFDKLFNIEIVLKLSKFHMYEVVGNRAFKKVGKNIRYAAIKLYNNNLEMNNIVDAINLVKELIELLEAVGEAKAEELYSAQYLFNDYRYKRGNFFLFKKIEEENGGLALPKEFGKCPLGGYKKQINNTQLIFKYAYIFSKMDKNRKQIITEASVMVPIKPGFYFKIKPRSSNKINVDEVYNVSPLEEFEKRYHVKSSNKEIVEKILTDEMKRNIVKVQMGEFYVNSYEGINFMCYSEVKEYEEVLAIIRVIEELSNKYEIINRELLLK